MNENEGRKPAEENPSLNDGELRDVSGGISQIIVCQKCGQVYTPELSALHAKHCPGKKAK